MKIGNIVGSNSHIDYVARVDAGEGVRPSDHGFGQFVAMRTDETFVGVVYDSRLINPEFSNFGPRLQPRPAIDEPNRAERPGVLIGIILLGTVGPDGSPDHSIPRKVVPVGQAVEAIEDTEILRFHTGTDGSVNLGYYQRIVSHSGQFAVPLLEYIIDKLCTGCSDAEKERLLVLKNSLKWQSTFAGMKL